MPEAAQMAQGPQQGPPEAIKNERWKICQWTGENVEEMKRISNFDRIVIDYGEESKRFIGYINDIDDDENSFTITVRKNEILLSRDQEEYRTETLDGFKKDWLVMQAATPEPSASPAPRTATTEQCAAPSGTPQRNTPIPTEHPNRNVSIDQVKLNQRQRSVSIDQAELDKQNCVPNPAK